MASRKERSFFARCQWRSRHRPDWQEEGVGGDDPMWRWN
jgi:hypothetical protein